MKFQEALNCYLIQNFENIKNLYDWPFSTKNLPIAYKKQFNDCYRNSLDLRIFIHDNIKNRSPKSDALQLWYVRDWGGVKSNSESTLSEYLRADSQELINRVDKGIASWSKMLSVRDPNAFAIYDARVALALNTISLMQATNSKIVFPQLSSRNKKIIPAQKEIKKFSKEHKLLCSKDFYKHYLGYLNSAVKECGYVFDIQTAEMILFANAEILASKWAVSQGG